MARRQATTTERGLGNAHQADKRRLSRLFTEGDPCPYGAACKYPDGRMWSWQGLDRDHVIPRALGGSDGPAVLSHAKCNRSYGATLGNQMRPFRPAAAAPSPTCPACGQRYHYAARICEICTAHYHPSYGEQRTCGRVCGGELRRRQPGGYAGQQVRRPRQPAPNPQVTAWVEAIHQETMSGWRTSRAW